MSRPLGAQINVAALDESRDLVDIARRWTIGCQDRNAFTHERMHACVPGARLEVFEQCGHLSTIEQPEAVTALLSRWLAQTQAG